MCKPADQILNGYWDNPVPCVNQFQFLDFYRRQEMCGKEVGPVERFCELMDWTNHCENAKREGKCLK